MVAIHDPIGAATAIDVLALMDGADQESFSAAMGGFHVRAASDPEEFLRELEIERPRVVVVAAPPASALTIEGVAAIHRRRPALRSVLVNAVDGVSERLHALELGYDAALPSGTPMSEVGGRVALLCRSGSLRGPARARMAIGDGVELDLSRGCLLRDGRQVHLRPKEFRLLEALARHPGRAYTRAELLDRVWGPGHEGNPRTVDVHIRWLRAKVERDPDVPLHLVTVRGRGYRLEPEAV